MTESELRAAVVHLAQLLGWKVFSLPISKPSRPVKDAVGYPDLTLARDKVVWWIELKTEEGRLSDDQMGWMKVLPSMLVIRPSDLPALGSVLA